MVQLCITFLDPLCKKGPALSDSLLVKEKSERRLAGSRHAESAKAAAETGGMQGSDDLQRSNAAQSTEGGGGGDGPFESMMDMSHEALHNMITSMREEVVVAQVPSRPSRCQ